MEAGRVQPMSVADDLAFEESSVVKHEFVGGEIHAMSDASLTHNRIAGRRSSTACWPGPASRPFLLRFSGHGGRVTADELQTLIEDATADYALGDSETALAKLARATTAAPGSFDAWHALAEVNFSLRRLDAALSAAERALALQPADVFINTTLSRIWMERGDKARAEHFGAQAKMHSWREELRQPPPAGAGPAF